MGVALLVGVTATLKTWPVRVNKLLSIRGSGKQGCSLLLPRLHRLLWTCLV